MGIKSLDDDLSFGTFSRVSKFRGLPEQRRANRRTHAWRHRQLDEDDVETYCDVCCCMDWHTSADWPCGKAPREQVGFLAPTKESHDG